MEHANLRLSRAAASLASPCRRLAILCNECSPSPLVLLNLRTQYRRIESKAASDVQGLADLSSRRLPYISPLNTLTKHVVVCREHKSGRSEQEREALNARFVEDIDQRVAALAKDAPNMKALEQFDVIKAGLCFAVPWI